MYDYDVIIVGGGLAGLTAAIDLATRKYSVLVLEKKNYPHHKVCGEYVSNEVMPYLKALGVVIDSEQSVKINNLQLSTISGKFVTTQLPLGGIGISRYSFDSILYHKALELGVQFIFQRVTSITFQSNHFEINTEEGKEFTSNVAIGAYGKRSNLDKQLNRNFIHKKSEWLGVKAHYQFDEFPINQVALHNFKGGYGGLSKTETGAVNFCYLTSYESFQKEKSVARFNENVVAKNPLLYNFLDKARSTFTEPLTIAQISFEQKKSVENHIIMCGDTAGLIHPLCGNGMAMAIHSAKIASEHIHAFLHKSYTRKHLEESYQKTWNKTFKQRLWMGRQLQSILLNEKLSNHALRMVVSSPAFLRGLIRKTHGKPILC